MDTKKYKTREYRVVKTLNGSVILRPKGTNKLFIYPKGKYRYIPTKEVDDMRFALLLSFCLEGKDVVGTWEEALEEGKKLTSKPLNWDQVREQKKQAKATAPTQKRARTRTRISAQNDD